jgi:hypothetical protein
MRMLSIRMFVDKVGIQVTQNKLGEVVGYVNVLFLRGGRWLTTMYSLFLRMCNHTSVRCVVCPCR